MLAHHHVGIRTADLDNCQAWYCDFLGAKQNWTLNRFSELTVSRLPGITRLTELIVDGVRFHLFEQAGRDDPATGDDAVGVQHVCLAVESPERLQGWRRRWVELYDSGRYAFSRTDQPTAIVTDAEGVRSFYAYDVNGLEFEFMYVPGGS